TRLLAVRKCRVVIGLRRQQRERIKSSCLVVVRILLVYLLHGGGVSPRSGFVVGFLAVGIERVQGLDVSALAVGWGFRLVGLLQLCRAALDSSFFRLIP